MRPAWFTAFPSSVEMLPVQEYLPLMWTAATRRCSASTIMEMVWWMLYIDVAHTGPAQRDRATMSRAARWESTANSMQWTAR